MIRFLFLTVFIFNCVFCYAKESSLENLSEFVYIQQSKKGTLIASEEEGYYTLTLKQNDRNLIFFADQPERITGKQSLHPFFSSWLENPKHLENPPTAFINYTHFHSTSEEGVTPDILQLNSPVYNAEQDTLTFKVKALHEFELKEGSFDNVVIIYDKY